MLKISLAVISFGEFDRKYTNGHRPFSAEDPFLTALAQQSVRHLVGGELTPHMAAFLVNVLRLVRAVGIGMQLLSRNKLQEVFIAFREWFIQNRQPNGEQEWQHFLECCRKNPVHAMPYGIVAALYTPGSFMFNESINRAFRVRNASVTAAGGRSSAVQSQQQHVQQPNHTSTVNAAGPVLSFTAAGLGVGVQQPFGPFAVHGGLPLSTMINNHHYYYGTTINNYSQPPESNSRVAERLDNLATEVVKINKNLGNVQDTLGHVNHKVDTLLSLEANGGTEGSH